jgi:hypothetical protein
MENLVGQIIFIIGAIISFLIACVINNKYNPKDHFPFKYGYFLSVITIFINLLLIIYIIIDINEKSYRAHYYQSEITIDIIMLIVGTLLLFSSAILNAKKYKIGAILVSIFTGNFIICIFYYKKRWHEFKNFSISDITSKMNKNNVVNMDNKKFENIDYKDILNKNNLEKYILVFEKQKLNELSLIINLTENDYEKLGINLMGDRKRLLKIFSKIEIENYIVDAHSIEKNEAIEKENINNNSTHGAETKIIICRNWATACEIPMEITIDEMNFFPLDNNSKVEKVIKNGTHSIRATFKYYTQCETLKFVALGGEIKINVVPKSNNEIIIERI